MAKLASILKKIRYYLTEFSAPLIASGMIAWGTSHFFNLKPANEGKTIHEMRQAGRIINYSKCIDDLCDETDEHIHIYETDPITKKITKLPDLIYTGKSVAKQVAEKTANPILIFGGIMLLYSYRHRKKNPFIQERNILEDIQLYASDLTYSILAIGMLSPVWMHTDGEVKIKLIVGGIAGGIGYSTNYTIPRMVRKRIKLGYQNLDFITAPIKKLWLLDSYKKGVSDAINENDLNKAVNEAYQLSKSRSYLNEREKKYAQSIMMKTHDIRQAVKSLYRLFSSTENKHLLNLIDAVSSFSINYQVYLDIMKEDMPDKVEYQIMSFALCSDADKKEQIATAIYRDRKNKGKLINVSKQTKNKVYLMDCDRLGMTFAIKEADVDELNNEVKQTLAIDHNKIIECSGSIVNIENLVLMEEFRQENLGLLWYSFVQGVSGSDYLHSNDLDRGVSILRNILRLNGIVSKYGIDQEEENIEGKIRRDIDNSMFSERHKGIFHDSVGFLTKYAHILPLQYDRDGNPDNQIITGEKITLIDLDKRKKSNIAYSAVKTLEQDTVLPYDERGWEIRNRLIPYYIESAGFEGKMHDRELLCNHHTAVPLKAISYSAFAKDKEGRMQTILRFCQSAEFALAKMLQDFRSFYSDQEIMQAQAVREVFKEHLAGSQQTI
ncbi:hypothetical protein H6503_01080 [Candidatus Woesearchaeota archaeon]|nr:hypothetical protein [Candidatus Woesearchaeota archaeon]